MEYSIREVIEYQKQILERNEIAHVLPRQWKENTIIYIDAGKKSICDYLAEQRDIEELTALLQGCRDVMEQSEDLFLDTDRWIWNIEKCFWDGKTVQGMYLPDRAYTVSFYSIYEQISYVVLLNMLNNGWYDENVILFMYRIHMAAKRKDINTLYAEIADCSKIQENKKGIDNNSIINKDHITTDEELFQEWDLIQQEEQMLNTKRKKKFSLPFL